MNRYIILGIFIIAIINIGYAYAIEYNSYKGILYGFRIDYPKDWVVSESEYTFSYIKVSFTSNATNDYNPYMLIGIENVKNVTIDKYTTLLINHQMRYLNNFTLIQIYDNIIDNHNAKSIEYSGIDNNIHIKGLITYTIIDNTAYAMIASSKYDEFNDNKVIFDHMISTFKIDKSIMPKPAPSIYEDSYLKIRFPKGWNGLMVNVDNTTNIRLKPNMKSDTLLNIVIDEINNINIFNNIIINTLSKDKCSVINLNFITINNTKGLEISQNCNDSISKTYLFAISNKVLAIELITTHEELNAYANDIYEMVKSIESVSSDDISIYLDNKLKDIPERINNLDIIPDLEGWNIFKKVSNDAELIYITHNGSNIVNNYSSFIITNRLDIDKILTLNNLNTKCNITNIYYITKKDNLLEHEALCTNDINVRVFKLDNYTIGYISKDNINENFTSLLSKFIDIDLIKVLMLKDQLVENNYPILINGSETILKYSSINIIINNITFNGLRLVLNLSNIDNKGLLIIENKLLEGPYIINNNIIDVPNVNKFVFNDIDNNTIITIDGRRVIPETYLPLLLITLSIIILIIKYRIFKIDIWHVYDMH